MGKKNKPGTKKHDSSEGNVKETKVNEKNNNIGEEVNLNIDTKRKQGSFIFSLFAVGLIFLTIVSAYFISHVDQNTVSSLKSLYTSQAAGDESIPILNEAVSTPVSDNTVDATNTIEQPKVPDSKKASPGVGNEEGKENSKMKSDDSKLKKEDPPATENSKELPKKNQEKEKEIEKKKSKKSKAKKDNISNAYDKKIGTVIGDVEKLLKQGKYQKCISSADTALTKYSLSPRLVYVRAQCLDKLAEKQRSNDILQQAIDAYAYVVDKPDVPLALTKLAMMTRAKQQQFLGKNGDAIKTLKRLLSLLPEDIEPLKELGVTYLLAGKNKLALDPFQRILKIDPDNGFAKVHVGFIMKSETKYAESIPYLSEGIKSGEPAAIDSRFYFHLGDAYYRTGQRDKAYQTYQEGADKGVFLSVDQRSSYNAESKLRAQPWWTAAESGYEKDIKTLERNWKTFRDEAFAIIDKNKNEFPLEGEDLLHKGDWRQFDLWTRGRKINKNCNRVPKTCAIIDKIPSATGNKRGQIKFSIMQPDTHIWPHTGPTNCRLRMHLGLSVPPGVTIRVGRESGTWKNGKIIIIDDSFDHEVWHNGTKSRLILIIDFWHPDIPQWERNKLGPI